MAKIIKKNRGSDLTMIKEQEAIEICKKEIIEPFYDFPNPTSIELKDTDVEAIETVLSMLKEKDKIINEQLKENVRLQKELNEENERCMILANNDKFKEQAIDLMSITIIQRDIGKNYCEFDKKCCKCENGSRDFNCKDCIKRYYEGQVKE